MTSSPEYREPATNEATHPDRDGYATRTRRRKDSTLYGRVFAREKLDGSHLFGQRLPTDRRRRLGRSYNTDGDSVPQDDPLTALEDQLHALTRQARASTRDYARAIHPNLDPTSYPLLVLLSKHSRLRVSELAAELALEKSTVSRQIDAVERLGLVRRLPDPEDARARLVVITEDGQEKVGAQRQSRREQWRAALNRWEPRDLEELTRLLEKLVATNAV